MFCERLEAVMSEMIPSHSVFCFFPGADPTRIIQGPVDMEIIVGESIVLPCQVASDPVLDVSFSWAFNGQLIAKGEGHFELVGGVSDPLPHFRSCEWAVGISSRLAYFSFLPSY